MTGSVDDLDDKLVRAIRSPAFYFIQKPFDREVCGRSSAAALICAGAASSIAATSHNWKRRLPKRVPFSRACCRSAKPTSTVWRSAAAMHRISGLGGDLYDYAPAQDEAAALLIADVSGHGVSAAMLTGIVKSAFQAGRVDRYDPLAVVHRVWNGLATFSPERFVTLFAAVVAPRAGELRYVNAGHPAALLWRWVAAYGVAVEYRAADLSRAAGFRWEVASVPVRPGTAAATTMVVSDVLHGPMATWRSNSSARLNSERGRCAGARYHPARGQSRAGADIRSRRPHVDDGQGVNTFPARTAL